MERDTNSVERALIECCKEYLQHSREAAKEHQEKVNKTWDMINGKVDWGHKQKDQARVHLNSVGVALERFKSQVKQGIANFDQFLSVDEIRGMESELMNAGEARRFIDVLTDEQNLRTTFIDLCGTGSVENLMAAKVRPVIKKVGKKKQLKIQIDNLDVYTYYFDTYKAGLYEIHQAPFDKYQLVKFAKDQPGYYVDRIESLTKFEEETAQEENEKKAPRHVEPKSDRRQNVVVHEFWGTFLDHDGNVLVWEDADGKLPLENVVVVLANESVLIAKPTKNPYYFDQSPFVTMNLLRDHKSPYKKGLMMHGVDLNWIEDELVSSLIDAAMKEAQNVNVVKVGGLADQRQISGGLKYNQTILQNSSLAPGDKLIETQKLGSVPNGAFQVLGLVQKDLAENVMSNEMNLSGGLTSKQTRATEIVQSQQVVQSLSDSINFDIDDLFVETMIYKVFCIGLQFAKHLSDDDLLYVFFGDEERAAAFKEAAKKPKELYEELGYSFRFKGRGIRAQITNARNAQALSNFVNIMFSNPFLSEIMEREYSLPEIAGLILKGNGIDPEKVKITEREKKLIEMRQLIREQALVNAEATEAAGVAPGANPQSMDGETGSGSGVV